VPPRVVAVVLAAGRSSRFGSPKVVAPLDGRPVLAHVLARIRSGGIDEPVVVLGDDAAMIEAAVRWPAGARRVVNPDPSRGLASSLALGVAAARAGSREPEAILIALGDQPRVSPDVIRALIDALDDPRPIKVPRYGDASNPNPVLLERAAFDLVAAATGDRGLGPLIAGNPDLVHEIPFGGGNPDIDTPADLAAVERAGVETDPGPLRHPVP
jgi:molybdenum cofactor cytidylyltransferase